MKSISMFLAITLSFVSFTALANERIFPHDNSCRVVKGIPLYFCDGKDFGANSVEAGQPLKWNEQEIEFISKKLKVLVKDNRLKNFFARLNATGFDKLYRYQYAFFKNAQNTFTRSPLAMMTTQNADGLLVISDRFLTYQVADPISKFDRAELSLLHELFHAFDGPGFKYSKDENFLALAGWNVVDGAWKLDGAPASLKESMAAFQGLLAQGKFAEAFALSRLTTIPMGLSSLAVTANPHEYFAETAATLYFDPKAKDYIPADIKKWFFKNVLK